eukprot:956686-Karenia_brevis.AAC.1
MLWNGWPTSSRMRTCKGAGPVKACVLGCDSAAEDRIEHYVMCPVLWRFFAAPKPHGLGIPICLRSRSGLFAVDGNLDDEMITRIAIAAHIGSKTVMHFKDA